jgi:hypothetical protein
VPVRGPQGVVGRRKKVREVADQDTYILVPAEAIDLLGKYWQNRQHNFTGER